MTVREMLARMGSDELTYWMAAYNVEPWGEDRSDLRAGIVASAVVNGNPWRKPGSEPVSPVDFMPRFEKKPPETPEQKVARFKSTMRAHAALIEGAMRRGQHRHPGSSDNG